MFTNELMAEPYLKEISRKTQLNKAYKYEMRKKTEKPDS